jgi:hypothetical protein
VNAIKVLIPIRVPEFGPSVGKLTTETVGADPVGRHVVRMQLVTKLFEMAGESRRLASQKDREAATGSLSREAWLSLWEEATLQLSSAVFDYAVGLIEDQSSMVRMPVRLKQKVELTDEDRRAIAGRLGACGSEFVHVLDDVATTSSVVLGAHPDQKEILQEWQEAQLRAARRLEHAWSLVEIALNSELAYWEAAANRIGGWKRSPVPVLVFLVLGSVVAIWLGLILGGYIESPGWFTWFWQSLFGTAKETAPVVVPPNSADFL